MKTYARRIVAARLDVWHAGCLDRFRIHLQASVVKKIDMDTYSPELSRLFHETQTPLPSACDAKCEEEKRAQEAALVELAERISAARSIV